MKLLLLTQIYAEITNALIGQLDLVMLGRMLVTLLLCGAIGLERSTHERASGLRTHILVGLGACLMTQAGGYGFSDLPADGRDPLRLASYVISGIGFLGAGAILRHGTTVRGLTTAASLWAAAGIGVAVGVGLAGLATATVVLILFTLVPLQKWEARLGAKRAAASRHLAIHLREDGAPVGKVLVALGKQGVQVRRATVIPGAGTSAVLQVELETTLAAERARALTERLLALKMVERVEAATPAPGARQPPGDKSPLRISGTATPKGAPGARQPPGDKSTGTRLVRLRRLRFVQDGRKSAPEPTRNNWHEREEQGSLMEVQR